MSKDLQSLIAEHHAFYEVSPYYLVLKDNPGHASSTSRTIQAGFDLDLFGLNSDSESLLPGPDYALASAEVRRLVETVASRTSNSCSVEVISFPERIVLGGSSHMEPEGMLRIRISHHRGLDQPYGKAEEQALRDLEEQLKKLGIVRH